MKQLITRIYTYILFMMLTTTTAFAERMKFPAFILFTLLRATFVYDPFAHWVWGTGGWLREMGLLDFAGGTVIEILSVNEATFIKI